MIIAYLPFFPVDLLEDRASASKAELKGLDQLDRKLLSSVLAMLIILVVTIVFFLRFPNGGILLAGSLALAFFVVADIIWSR